MKTYSRFKKEILKNKNIWSVYKALESKKVTYALDARVRITVNER